MSDPTVQERTEQPYVAIAVRATLREWGEVNALVPEVYGWLAGRGVAPAGAVFYRHLVIGGMDEKFSVEVGVPVASPVQGDGRVLPGAKPAGRYVVAMHHGHPDGIAAAHLALVDWAAGAGVPLAVEADEDGEVWQGMFESYLTDPAVEPDPANWETELAYLVSGGQPPR
ncbi:MAG: AraC family transcriptional regulator [Actinophytocola sp.]|uniref:GyrI-like domain-containing protein n=1 Tax=Actinophytocola sp. TaxID=1872138 RepID=UPI0013280EF5|nr:GyrI-like domain-containing protein [Actinophytocola sp.]MPZ81333.1 AraC family transcriptional regulator [Actinophytocola sp.]